MNKIPENALYIGDGVYIWFDGYSIIAATHRPSEGGYHWIAFEPAMIEELYKFYKELKG